MGGGGVDGVGVCEVAGFVGAAAAKATVLRNARRPAGLLIWCECSMLRGGRFGAVSGGKCKLARRNQFRVTYCCCISLRPD